MPELTPTRWQQFFDSHAERYEENVFTKNTVAEVDFFLSLFPLSVGSSVLDVGCGTGRHSIELARRGFKVTGLDLSDGMLGIARKNAHEAGVDVEWVQGDATQMSFDRTFDAAICLCEGAFGLIEQGDDPEEHDRAILRKVSAALKPGGPFLLTALNGYSAIRRIKDENVISGAFDPVTMVAEYADDWELPEGQKTVLIRERLFIAPEITRMLRESGFRVDHVYGGTAGNWGRRPLNMDEVEAMFVCRRV
jgi:2-polyprenyl-3-methyl-5-hydroxy-6-metoxy-1,4-benzoquinol methylase